MTPAELRREAGKAISAAYHRPHSTLDDVGEAALAVVRAVLLEEAAPPLWTVANHDTYAVLIAPDGHIAARFHVVAECEAVARVLNGAMRVGGGET